MSFVRAYGIFSLYARIFIKNAKKHIDICILKCYNEYRNAYGALACEYEKRRIGI